MPNKAQSSLRSGTIYKPTELNSTNTEEVSVLNTDVDVNICNMATLDSKHALRIVPTYDGNPNDLDRFLSCCEIVLQPLKIEEHVKFIQLLKAKLTGKAYNVVRYKEFKDYKLLKQEFIMQFGETRSTAQLQLELIKISQEKNENIRSYANRVQGLLTQLNEVCLNNIGQPSEDIYALNEQTALKSFQEGLLDPIKLIVKACRFKTLKEAIAQAYEEEINNQGQSSSVTSKIYQKPQVIRCQICHKQGHSSATCFLRYRVENPSRSLPNNNHQIRIICSFCKNKGHSIHECRKRIYKESKSIQQYKTDTNLASNNQFRSKNLILPENKPSTSFQVKDM